MIENWKTNRLEEICTYITDGAHNSPKSVEQGIPMASVKDMTNFGFDYNLCRQICYEDYLKLKKGNNEPKNDDILIAKDGSYLKHCFIYQDEPKEVVLLSSIAIFRPDKEKVNPKFLAYLFKSPYVKGMARNYVSGVAIPRIVLSDFKKLRLNLPPLPTQRKIAAILSAYDDLIENNLKRIKLLEEKAQLTYEEWFVRMRFPGHETTPIHEETGLPEGWEKRKIGDIIEVSSSKRIFLSDYVETGIPFYRGKEIILKSKNEALSEKLYISKEKFLTIKSKYGAPAAGDLLITAVGTLGFPYLITDSDGDFYFKDGNLIWLKGNNKICSYYLISLFKTNHFKAILKNIAIGSSQKALTIKSLKNLCIEIPSIELSNEFENLIKPILKEIEILQNQNQLLKEARDILLPRLMTGMIDVEKLSESGFLGLEDGQD